MLSRRTLAFTAGLGGSALLASALPSLVKAADAAPESAFARIRRTKQLRVGAVAAGAPYYRKDQNSGQWTGFYYNISLQLAKDLEADLVVHETVWGNGVLDIQSGKVDVFFGLTATPKRALAIDFTDPVFTSVVTAIMHKDIPVSRWEDLNRPEVRIAVDSGSSHDQTVTAACPKATILRFNSVEEATTAVMANRADLQAVAILLALGIVKKVPAIGHIVVPTPRYENESAGGIAREPDKTFRDYLGYWIRFNKGNGFIRQSILDSLPLIGLAAADWPKDLPL